ncbi:MAG: CPBP family intramembrane metalloprotease [Alphaproteobacteria bacterium]|nr:CPBP family intramembrane metalloprotease [Alphaproteobacteria bacterium]MBV9370337.1 CPBP family intramembrane metalloprotease [Alphaproteobacteria bacterium]MBV9902006.1 CPBP family intramembrane metalloprotease [Alphaproteobacteria bacterium]
MLARLVPPGGPVELGDRRVLAPGKWRWLRAIAWGVLLFFLLLVGAGFAGLAAGWVAAGGHATAMLLSPQFAPGQVSLVAAAVASLALYVGLVRLGEDRRPSELALRPAAVELPLGLLLGAAMMAATILLLHLAGAVAVGRQPVTAFWNAVALSVQSGVAEEILLRLVVLRLLWRAFGIWPALALSALLFGVLHLANPNSTWFAALAIALEAGVMLAAFYILTGRLWVSIGVHAGWNFTQGWLFGAAVSGTDGFAGGPLVTAPMPGLPQWLSGGAFGPEASFAGLLVGTLAGLAALRLAWRRGRFRAADAPRDPLETPPEAPSAATGS